MYAIGIRELKAKLSEYLRLVRDGQVILVSDRGRVVAELRSPTVRELADHELATTVLVARGELTLAQTHDPSVYVPSLVNTPDGTAADILSQVREDQVTQSKP